MNNNYDNKAMSIFNELRRDLFDEIRKRLEEDGLCKRYEGCFEVTVVYPNYFEEKSGENEPYYVVTLDCYVVGPSRHYNWQGKTLLEAVQTAERDIRKWIDGYDGHEYDDFNAKWNYY